jgi:hypothetical protein
MTKFGSWMVSSLPRFISAAGIIFGTPLAVGFIVTAYNRGELTVRFLALILIVSAVSGMVWAFAMWFPVRALVRKGMR